MPAETRWQAVNARATGINADYMMGTYPHGHRSGRGAPPRLGPYGGYTDPRFTTTTTPLRSSHAVRAGGAASLSPEGSARLGRGSPALPTQSPPGALGMLTRHPAQPGQRCRPAFVVSAGNSCPELGEGGGGVGEGLSVSLHFFHEISLVSGNTAPHRWFQQCFPDGYPDRETEAHSKRRPCLSASLGHGARQPSPSLNPSAICSLPGRGTTSLPRPRGPPAHSQPGGSDRQPPRTATTVPPPPSAGDRRVPQHPQLPPSCGRWGGGPIPPPPAARQRGSVSNPRKKPRLPSIQPQNNPRAGRQLPASTLLPKTGSRQAAPEGTPPAPARHRGLGGWREAPRHGVTPRTGFRQPCLLPALPGTGQRSFPKQHRSKTGGERASSRAAFSLFLFKIIFKNLK